jgi:hypothetical protein
VDLPLGFAPRAGLAGRAVSNAGVFCAGVELKFLSQQVLSQNEQQETSTFIAKWGGSSVAHPDPILGTVLGTSAVSSGKGKVTTDLVKVTQATESDTPRIKAVSKQINDISKEKVHRGDCSPAKDWPDCEILGSGRTLRQWSSLSPLGLGDDRVFASLKLIRSVLEHNSSSGYLCESCRAPDSIPAWYTVVAQERSVVYAVIDGTSNVIIIVCFGAVMLVVWAEVLLSVGWETLVKEASKSGGAPGDKTLADTVAENLQDDVDQEQEITAKLQDGAALPETDEAHDEWFNADRHGDETYWLAVAERLRPHILRATDNYSYFNPATRASGASASTAREPRKGTKGSSHSQRKLSSQRKDSSHRHTTKMRAEDKSKPGGPHERAFRYIQMAMQTESSCSVVDTLLFENVNGRDVEDEGRTPAAELATGCATKEAWQAHGTRAMRLLRRLRLRLYYLHNSSGWQWFMTGVVLAQCWLAFFKAPMACCSAEDATPCTLSACEDVQYLTAAGIFRVEAACISVYFCDFAIMASVHGFKRRNLARAIFDRYYSWRSLTGLFFPAVMLYCLVQREAHAKANGYADEFPNPGRANATAASARSYTAEGHILDVADLLPPVFLVLRSKPMKTALHNLVMSLLMAGDIFKLAGAVLLVSSTLW